MKIAIHRNHKIFQHSTAWDVEWENYCIEKDLDFEIVNCYDNNILEKLKDFDVLLWHFSGYALQEMLFARTILTAANRIGLKVFPDFNTAWHFDDKVAESYLLKTVNAPTPKNFIFYTRESAIDFLQNECSFPIIGKLRTGSGSNNVVKINNYTEGMRYIKKMFNKGFNPTPKVLFKVSSNLKSAKDLSTINNRLKRIPDFLESLRKTKEFPNEKKYTYFQEFIPNNGYDLKVVVVGDKLSFLSRKIRKNDFRASGGGNIIYDKEYISEDIRQTAFKISQELEFQCMGYDFVVDKINNEPKIIEISYGFSHTAQMDLGGYWTQSGEWVEEPLNAPVEIINNLIESYN